MPKVNAIGYADLHGTPEEMELRSKIKTILKHHQINNGVLIADLVSMILAHQTLKGISNA